MAYDDLLSPIVVTWTCTLALVASTELGDEVQAHMTTW